MNYLPTGLHVCLTLIVLTCLTINPVSRLHAQGSTYCAVGENKLADIVVVLKPSLKSGLDVRSEDQAKQWLSEWNSSYVFTAFQMDKDTGLANVLRKRTDYAIVASNDFAGGESFCFGSCIIATHSRNVDNMNVTRPEDLVVYLLSFPNSPHAPKVREALSKYQQQTEASRDPWHKRVDEARRNKKVFDEKIRNAYLDYMGVVLTQWQSTLRPGVKAYMLLIDGYVPNSLSPLDSNALDIPSFDQLGSIADRMLELDNNYESVNKNDVATIEQLNIAYQKHGDTLLKVMAARSIRRGKEAITEAEVLVSGYVRQVEKSEVKIEIVSVDFQRAREIANDETKQSWLRKLCQGLIRSRVGDQIWTPKTFTFPGN
ncbi:MAG: hypothetical protein IPI29_14435 [Ignavibacteria bacterium]|nr:hypothetical protein [Ignavibacteria bacterium]